MNAGIEVPEHEVEAPLAGGGDVEHDVGVGMRKLSALPPA
jgi:hypothetical protein